MKALLLWLAFAPSGLIFGPDAATFDAPAIKIVDDFNSRHPALIPVSADEPREPSKFRKPAEVAVKAALQAEPAARAVISDKFGNPPPTKDHVGEGIVLSAKNSVAGPDAKSFKWSIKPKSRADRASRSPDNKEVTIFYGPEPVVIEVRLLVAKGDEPSEAELTIVVGNPPVPPNPIPPPGPTPNPDPTPGPGPAPAPTPATGLRVLVVRETGDAARVDQAFAASVREYLKSKCAKDSKGQSEFRVWDDDTEIDIRESATLRDMFEKAKPFQQLPALILKNDKSANAVAMPLPPTPEALLAELRKWGG